MRESLIIVLLSLFILAGCETEGFSEWVSSIPETLEPYYTNISTALHDNNYTALGVWADKLAEQVNSLKRKAKTFHINEEDARLLNNAFDNLSASANYLKKASQFLLNGDFASGIQYINKYNVCTDTANVILQKFQ